MRYLIPILTVLPSLLTAASLDEALALKKDQRLPEAEAAFSAILAGEPDNLRALSERATVRGWQQRYPEAIADWKAVLARESNQVDAHVGLARVLFWSGQRPAALAELDRALLLSPRDASLWELKGDIARADGNRALALTAYREADRLDPQGRVGDRLGRIELPPTQWRVDVGGISDRYTAVRSNEAAGYANLSYAHRPEREGGPAWTAGGGVVVERRFDATDVSLQVEGATKVTDILRVGARGGYAPGADFLPDWKVGGSAELRPVRTFALLLDVDHNQYNDSERQVVQVTPGAALTVWRLTGELRYRGTIDQVPGSTGKGDAVIGRMSADFGWLRPSLAYLQGREPDPPFPIANVQAVWGSIEFPIDQRLSLRVDGAFEHREDSAGGTLYDRTSIGGGVILRF